MQANVRLMIDAEHSYFQPAIDHAVLELQRVFNVHRPTVFNTIQCYTKVYTGPLSAASPRYAQNAEDCQQGESWSR